jgi:stearoyl-CoA desaturase (delta-9 desaturase)
VGLRWWELDMGWWVLKIWERLGLIWDLKCPNRETIKALKA